MKKLLYVLPLVSLFLVGYTYPEGEGYYIIDCAIGSGQYLYFPKDSLEYLYVTDTDIINTKSSTIYGYCNSHQIYFPTYDEPYYYVYTSSYNRETVALNITSVDSSNLDPSGENALKSNNNVIQISILGGILFLCLYMANKH